MPPCEVGYGAFECIQRRFCNPNLGSQKKCREGLAGAAPLRHPIRPSHFKSKRTFNLSSRSPVHIGVLFPAFNRGAKAHDTSVYEVRGISTCARVLEKSRLCEFAAQVYVSIGSCVNSSWCRCGNRVGTGTAKRAPALPAGAGPKVKSTPAPSISYTCANDTFHLRD